jgi:hypothetical protein
MGDIRGVRFEDINGDGRDDWLWVGDDGATTTYTNSRSCRKGQVGDGLSIVWRQGFHHGMGALFGTTSIRDNVYFARVYGQSASFGLRGLQDYVYFENDTSTMIDDRGPTYRMHVWKNIGAGGAKVKCILLSFKRHALVFLTNQK